MSPEEFSLAVRQEMQKLSPMVEVGLEYRSIPNTAIENSPAIHTRIQFHSILHIDTDMVPDSPKVAARMMLDGLLKMCEEFLDEDLYRELDDDES